MRQSFAPLRHDPPRHRRYQASSTTTYDYDGFGAVVQTTGPLGNVVTNSYDLRGSKIASRDPDLGSWSYAYNTLGQLTSQTDAKGQVTAFSYDLLGRAVQRVEPDMTAVWVYDTGPNASGKLISTSITAGADAGYQRGYTYDTLGRPVPAATTISGTTYTFSASYDAQLLANPTIPGMTYKIVNKFGTVLQRFYIPK